MADTPSNVNILAHGTFQTPDAIRRIRIIGDPYLDRTDLDAQITVGAHALNVEPHVTHAVEERIERAKRTYCAAKRPQGENKEEKEHGENADFEDVQPSNHSRFDHRCRKRGINGIPKHPGNPGAQGPPWTYP